jgi:phage terminase large subunit
MKACKGPGKTAVLAWLGWNFLATRPHPKCAATSISGENLADNFWTEMAKWQAKNAFLKAKFTWTKTRIVANDHPETWFMSARSWPQSADATKQADTLAGLHADYILFIIDESGGIPDAVMVSAEAALSSCVEGHIVQAGNPTMLSGPLYRACALERRLWYVIEITGDPDDAKRSPRISVEWAKAQIEKYGRDNPWVLVNVFGRFPPSSLNVLIGPDEVRAAMKRYYREFEIGKAPKILGVDVARFGDDASVIMPRQGIQMFKPAKYRNIDSRRAPARSRARSTSGARTRRSSTRPAASAPAGSTSCARSARRRSASSSPARRTTSRATSTSARRCISTSSNGSSAAARCRRATSSSRR